MTKVFRITYIKVLYIRAENELEAEAKAANATINEELGNPSVEEVSEEDVKDLEVIE